MQSKRLSLQNERKLRKEVVAAYCGSQVLAQLSTAQYVNGLNFWVRDGSRCCPAALAATTRLWSKIRDLLPAQPLLSPCLVEDQRSSPQEANLTAASLKAKVRI